VLAQFVDVVDLSKVRSNDIYAVLCTFGVEAARRAIVDEINGVFKVLFSLKLPLFPWIGQAMDGLTDEELMIIG